MRGSKSSPRWAHRLRRYSRRCVSARHGYNGKSAFLSNSSHGRRSGNIVSGETHLYLGRQYNLKVVPDVQQQVKLYRGRLIVQSLRPKQRDVTKALVEQWYRERAQAKFRERLALCQQRFSKLEDFEPAGLVIMQLRQRWGSMTPTGKLILNRVLIRASVDAIDYVITHELCHMRHNHHGGAFFDLLDRVMPDWEKRKLKLECQLA